MRLDVGPPAAVVVRRQHLVWADRRALQAAAGSLDDVSRAVVDHWTRIGAPVVVTRQPPGPADGLHVGLPAPLRWQRRRIALRLPPGSIERHGAFPPAHAVLPLLPPEHRQRWRDLGARLDALGADTRVYGGYGWQTITGEPYVHPSSDLDLLLVARDADHADAIVERLATAWPVDGPRLDGELWIADGSGIAWREWQRWRAGRTDRVLVKRLHGVALEAEVRFGRATVTAPPASMSASTRGG